MSRGAASDATENDGFVDGVGRPLEGIRVLSMEQAAALPYATRHLADLGADVIRVASPKRPAGGLDNVELVRDKRQLALDLDSPGGPEAFRRVAAGCDVVAHNFTPRVMRKYGIDPAKLRAADPTLVYLSLTGAGTTGPWADRPLFGPGAEAASGHALLIGDPDGWPGRPGTVTYADNTCGLYAAFAVLAALEERSRTGTGSHIDVSLYETAVSALGPVFAERALGAVPQRSRNADARFALHGVFAAKGHDRSVAIAATADQLPSVAGVLGIGASPEVAAGFEGEVEIAAATWVAADLVDALQRVGVAAALAADSADVATDPHLRARGWFGVVPRAAAGHAVDVSGPAWGGGAEVPMSAAHAVGADSRDVLRDVGGLPDAEIDDLMAAGTVGDLVAPSRPGTSSDPVVRIDRGELSRVDVDVRERLQVAREAAVGAAGPSA